MFIGLIIYCEGQTLPNYSKEGVDEAYQFINQYYSQGNIYSKTMGSETVFYGSSLRYQVLNKENRERTPSGVLAITPYLDFDTLMTKEQREELVWKFEHLPEFDLDPKRLTARIIFDEDLKKANSAPIDEKFGFSRISFPIFQKGKDGIVYAIIADNGTDSLGFSAGGNMHVYRKIEEGGKWEYFCIVSLWL
jgi:hypothetical protein